MEWERLREKVLKSNYPKKNDIDLIQDKYDEISEYIKNNFGLETHFAGSASRETCMKDDKDIDIFVLFPQDTDNKELEDKGLDIGKSVFEKFDGDYKIEYAEHPYTKGKIEGYEVEIVPCYDIEPENIKSSVDRTPHHSKWVQNNLSESQRKDVVILKKFLKTGGLYGSSLKIQGFSGYLCEILIYEYGSFQDLLREAVNWENKQLIDPEKHHEKLPDNLTKKFENDNLIVIDPVDKERNVASVMSEEKISEFIFRSWRFRQDPGMDFFKETQKTYSEFEIKQELNKRSDLIILEFRKPQIVDDVLYPQLRKTLNRLCSELDKKEFKIYEKSFFVGDCVRIILELDRNLPEVEETKGPSVYHGEEHLSEFTSKYDNVFIEGKYLRAKIDRDFTDAKKFLENFLNEELREKGIPKNIASCLDDYSFIGPLEPSDQEWLNYLGETFNVQEKR